MSRIALIGENSIEYVNILLDIWNNGNCAVLIDWRIPFNVAYEMMIEANVSECYIESTLISNELLNNYNSIKIVSYNNNTKNAKLLPENIYYKYKDNYDTSEAVIMYSSGTTGKSKGVILSHYSINTNADAILDYMQLNETDCIYIVKSLSHSSTLTGELLVALKTNTRLIISPTIVTPHLAIETIRLFNVTILCLNPTLLELYFKFFKKTKRPFYSLKSIYVSGSILTEKLYNIVHSQSEVNIFNVYGLSEAGPRVAAQRANCCKTNSVGKPLIGIEILILNKYGTLSKTSCPGEVYIKTPSIFTDYVDGSISDRVYEGWIKSGDIGFFNEYEELIILGRQDDMINSMGHNVFPYTVESVILKNKYVKECVVFMTQVMDSKNACHNCLACIYSGNSPVSRKEFIKLCKSMLADYEIPKIFIFVNDIPKNGNGKIDRKIIRRKYGVIYERTNN